MALAIAIFYIRKADDEKDQLAEMKKDNTFFQLRYLRAQLIQLICCCSLIGQGAETGPQQRTLIFELR